ncbi:MAG: histidine kinase [Planctomycetes bacterium]|nr:histidine kinase [Planctomycetota bacterium]
MHGPTNTRRPRMRGMHQLMRYRVRRIMLVSSLYDSFIMSEEGHLHETLLTQFIALNLSDFPDLMRVPHAKAALEVLAEDPTFDLVIANIEMQPNGAADFARKVAAMPNPIPVIGLAYANYELRDFLNNEDASVLDRVFLWQGDVKLFVAMVKYLEDSHNLACDTGEHGVPAIIVVEDNIRFYSSFLPVIYSELFRHINRLLSEDLNLSQKMVRMRGRPKVVLATTYEEAWNYFDRYADEVLGVISDFEFPRNGELDKAAGFDLCTAALERRADLRIVLQSSIPSNKRAAEELGASFLLKGSPVLLHQLRAILVERFGFGDFIFRMANGHEIDRAHDLKSFAEKLRTVPAESVAYHAQRQHFSNWFKARCDFELADKLQPRQLKDFDSDEHLRADLLQAIDESRRDKRRTVVAEFHRESFDSSVSMSRIGKGSLGGKARGVAFANRILRDADIDRDFPGVAIQVPPCAVLATDVFDAFLDENWALSDFALDSRSDKDLTRRFIEAPLAPHIVEDLRAYLAAAHYPLAVRSSGLMEDSLSQPFAGVYRTCILPNNHPDDEIRLEQLVRAIKQVYASAFSSHAKSYLSMTSYRLEEEKMAVMLQQLVGIDHGTRFYPDFAGVARSYNFYPEPGQRAEDGVVAVALGMGRTVVEGAPCIRFNPLHPKQIVAMSTVPDMLRNSQRAFYALDLTQQPDLDGVFESKRYELRDADADGTLTWMGSTYLADSETIVDGVSREGPRVVTFAQILKHDAFPLAKLIDRLLHECARGTGGPVEIEFAGTLARSGRPAQFGFLQLRPLALSREHEQVEIGAIDSDSVVCSTTSVLGSGRIDNVFDLVVVDRATFDRLRSREAAAQVARFDANLRHEARPYVLIGVGRWGSSDPSLGIPVSWDQIAGVRVIVEAGFQDVCVMPSQGTHFFQNLTSCNVGYLTVNPEQGQGTLDWEWLRGLDALEETEFVRLIRLDRPLLIKVNAKAGRGVILKPGTED